MMKRQNRGKRTLLWLIAILFVGSGLAPYASDTKASAAFDSGAYASVLETYVDGQGRVDYKELKANRTPLDEYLSQLARLDRSVYNPWNDSEKIAFWINAYNALTLKAIIDNYPIQSSFLASLRFPKNSIRQISGVWDKLKHPVMGRQMTLDDIEHQTLRAEFNEPRIHMALVCASIGCPFLRREPYSSEQLDAQLDDQTRAFLGDPEKFRIDRASGRVYLSPIFDWFGKDFVKHYAPKEGFPGHSDVERAVLNFIGRYVVENDRKYLATARYDIDYLDYDWSLNEQ